MKKNRPFNSKDWRLIKAVQDCNLSEAQDALVAGAHINGADLEGRTALHWAARNGDAVMLDFLLKACADVNAQDDRGRTPLHLAAGQGQTQVVQKLLTANAFPQMRDDMNDTALHSALEGGHADAAVAILANSPYLAAWRGQSGMTPLHLAAQHTHLTFLLKDIAIAGSPLEDKNTFGETPLHRAATRDNLSGVQWLVEEGANAKSADVHGMTPAKLAEDKGLARIVDYLKDADQHRARAITTRYARKQAAIAKAKEDMLRPSGTTAPQAITVRKPLKITRKPLKPIIRKK